MIEMIVTQIDAMTLAERLHTFSFTVFVVAGALCCFLRSERRQPSGPMPRARD